MITFYNKNRKVVMVLHDFSFNNEQEIGMNFSVDISYMFYKASSSIQDYKVYFDRFLSELEMLYDNKTTNAKFIPIERQLEIYLERIDYGHILVTIKLNHFNLDYIMLESMLLIKYEIDQSFLPELIKEISNIMN